MLFSASYPSGLLRRDDSYAFIGDQLKFAVIGLGGMAFAALVNGGMAPSLAACTAALIGVCFGLTTSFFVVRLKFNSLITTIAVSTIAGAIASIIYKGALLPVKGISAMPLYKFFRQNVAGFPVVFVLAIGIFFVALIVQEKTKFCHYMYALSENRQAVTEAGVKSNRALTGIFVISALCAAVAGVIYVLTVYKAGQPAMGASFFLDGFTVVFLGAMAFRLGKANVAGTFISALVLSSLTSGLTMLGKGFAVGQVIKGLLLIMGVAVVTIYRRQIIPKGSKMKYE
jgi:ribose transport system permease protein